jgi:hypothetical protein
MYCNLDLGLQRRTFPRFYHFCETSPEIYRPFDVAFSVQLLIGSISFILDMYVLYVGRFLFLSYPVIIQSYGFDVFDLTCITLRNHLALLSIQKLITLSTFKGTTGQTKSAREWYQWIGLSKDMPHYRFF